MTPEAATQLGLADGGTYTTGDDIILDPPVKLTCANTGKALYVRASQVVAVQPLAVLVKAGFARTSSTKDFPQAVVYLGGGSPGFTVTEDTDTVARAVWGDAVAEPE